MIHHNDTSPSMHYARGFTLVETVIYLALFGIIMTGVVVAAYQMISSGGRTATKTLLETEGDFLIGKISWTVTGVQSIGAPPQPTGGEGCTQSDTLTVSKWNSSIGSVTINLIGGTIMISRGGNPSLPLNNTNTVASNLSFEHCYLGGENPESVSASFTLSARTPQGETLMRDFSTMMYLRK